MTPNLALCDLWKLFVIILNEILLLKRHAEIDYLYPQLLVMESDLRCGMWAIIDITLNGWLETPY